MITLEVIKKAAMRAAPREACGVVIENDEVYTTLICRNVSEQSGNFIIDPTDYLVACNLGEIRAIWHTHPLTRSEPSEADRASCNESNLPWFIYSLIDNKMIKILPEQKNAPLIGRSFVWGVFDCWTLIRDYYKQELGIIFPPIPPYEERFWEKGLNYYMDWYKMGDLEIVLPPPKAHDILLMHLHSCCPNHGAVLLPSGKILHHVQGKLSCESIYGNYWRHATCHILRHRSML